MRYLVKLHQPLGRGISTSPKATDPNDYTVSYRNIDIFVNLDDVSSENGIVKLTRAYTNPMNGENSIAFLSAIDNYFATHRWDNIV